MGGVRVFPYWKFAPAKFENHPEAVHPVRNMRGERGYGVFRRPHPRAQFRMSSANRCSNPFFYLFIFSSYTCSFLRAPEWRDACYSRVSYAISQTARFPEAYYNTASLLCISLPIWCPATQRSVYIEHVYIMSVLVDRCFFFILVTITCKYDNDERFI